MLKTAVCSCCLLVIHKYICALVLDRRVLSGRLGSPFFLLNMKDFVSFKGRVLDLEQVFDPRLPRLEVFELVTLHL